MTDYDKLLNKIRELGMDYRWAIMFIKKLKDDEEAFPVYNFETKKWALERGFYPGRVQLYNLTEANYHDYIPDYQYFMLHPLNNHFLKWLDKTTLKYILNSNGCEETMPEYYAYVENDLWNGKYTYLMDCPKSISKDENFLWNLLQNKKVLALKPNSGSSGGLGFIKLELKKNKLFENNKEITVTRFNEIRDSIRNYIITEYCNQHLELAKIWPSSECTLRVIMFKQYSKDKFKEPEWSCALSYARFGTSINGGASNLSSGGVGVGFNFETGEYKDFAIRYRRFTPDGKFIIKEHPDTKFIWEGKILPNWFIVKEKIKKICQHISSLDYLGLDIIITPTGMKLCEINSHPAIDYEQIMCGPILKNSLTRNFFVNKGLETGILGGNNFFKAYKDSQY